MVTGTSSPVSSRTYVTPVVLAATLGLTAVSWVVVLQAMDGMADGMAMHGSLVSFVAWWVPMMAAMMLPGAAPAVRAHARASGRVGDVPLFVGSYLAVWALVGVVAHVVSATYHQHGPMVAGVLAIAAGGYELTPLKGYFRHRCDGSVGTGLEYGLYCVGSSIGLMLLAVVGPMSVLWMCVLTVLAVGQKLLPPKPAIDVPVGLAIVGLGLAQLPL